MSLFHKSNKSFISFDPPEEGGDGLNDMIASERQEGAFDLFSQESGEALADYFNNALAMSGATLGDSAEREA